MISAEVRTFPRDLPDLKTAEEVSQKIPISAQRLAQLAESGFAPCWRIDGGPPLFQLAVVKKWVLENLTTIQEGAAPPTVHVVPSRKAPGPGSVPPILREVRGIFECPLSASPPGVYFLCNDDDVVYVGQSVQPLARVATHITSDKQGKFNRAFIVPCLPEHLTEVENAFIRTMEPPLNSSFPAKNTGDLEKVIQAMK
jgi:hypothetical protein